MRVVGLEFLVDLEIKEFLSLVKRIYQKVLKLRNMEENGQFVKEGGDKQTAEGVVNVFAVGLEIGVNFFLGKVQCLSPADVPAFEQSHFRVFAIILFLKGAVTQARIHHEHDI